MTTLRVATLNLWGRNGPWPDRLGLIRAELGRLSPRLLGLQEAMTDGDGRQADEIAEGLGYDVAYSPAATLHDGVLGNALLSDLPIREHRTFPLPTEPGVEPRALLYARVATPAGDLPVFVTHLDWQPDHGPARLAQTRFIAARVASLPCDLPPVLMGDFNAEPSSAEIRHLTGDGGGFADAWAHGGDGSAGETFSLANSYARRSASSSSRIDYVFTRGAGVARVEVAFRTPEGDVWPSDHFGLAAELII